MLDFFTEGHTEGETYVVALVEKLDGTMETFPVGYVQFKQPTEIQPPPSHDPRRIQEALSQRRSRTLDLTTDRIADMKYQIIRATNWQGMEQRVNEAIRSGWKPQGGVTFSMTDTLGNKMYAQAMIYEPPTGGGEG